MGCPGSRDLDRFDEQSTVTDDRPATTWCTADSPSPEDAVRAHVRRSLVSWVPKIVPTVGRQALQMPPGRCAASVGPDLAGNRRTSPPTSMVRLLVPLRGRSARGTPQAPTDTNLRHPSRRVRRCAASASSSRETVDHRISLRVITMAPTKCRASAQVFLRPKSGYRDIGIVPIPEDPSVPTPRRSMAIRLSSLSKSGLLGRSRLQCLRSRTDSPREWQSPSAFRGNHRRCSPTRELISTNRE